MGRDHRHYAGPGRVAHVVPTLLVLALLGGGLAAHRYEVGPNHLPWLSVDPSSEPELVPPPAGLELPAAAAPTPVAAPSTARPVDAAAVAAAVRPVLRTEPELGKRVAVAVGDLDALGPDWIRPPGEAFTPASTTKLFTAVAALEALGPDHRFRTKVVAGAAPGELVLVGGGDPYLTTAPPAFVEQGAEAAPADLTTLAKATAATLEPGVKVRLRYDASLFTGEGASANWRPDYLPDDVVAPIRALMLDGGREDGYARADDPPAAAAAAFAEQLRAAGVTVAPRIKEKLAPAGASEVAAVDSAPLADAVEHVISVSDNEGAELLSHAVGLAVEGEGSFEAGAAGTSSVLAGLGMDPTTFTLYDGSGLSRDNLVSPDALLAVLRLASDPARPELRAAWTGMPTAGFDGSLAGRFSTQPGAYGLVRAKTGTLTGVHALAGMVVDATGNPLVFVAAADAVGAADALDAQAALDRIAAALSACVCSESAANLAP